MPPPSPAPNAIRSRATTQLFLKRRNNLAFFANLLASLLLCGSVVLKDALMFTAAPCPLKSIGFRDIFVLNRRSDDIAISRLVSNLNRCVTPDVVSLMYSSLVLILLTLICTLLQLVSNLNCKCAFIKKLQSRGALDILSVFLCSLCLGFMSWAALLVARFQFQQMGMQLHIPMLSSSNETMQFIQNSKQLIDSFSLSFSGGFYFVLLAGLFNVIALAARNLSTSFDSLRRANRRRVEPHPHQVDGPTEAFRVD